MGSNSANDGSPRGMNELLALRFSYFNFQIVDDMINSDAMNSNISSCTQDKPKDLHWEVSQNNVVKYLLDGWNLREKGFTEADVNHVIGVLEVNAFEITQPATSNYLHLI